MNCFVTCINRRPLDYLGPKVPVLDSKLLHLDCNMFNLQHQQIKESGKHRLIRFVGVISFALLINHLIYLIGVWLGENQRTNIIKMLSLKEIGLHLQILLTTP